MRVHPAVELKEIRGRARIAIRVRVDAARKEWRIWWRDKKSALAWEAKGRANHLINEARNILWIATDAYGSRAWQRREARYYAGLARATAPVGAAAVSRDGATGPGIGPGGSQSGGPTT